jgi:GAF domain-containing protein
MDQATNGHGEGLHESEWSPDTSGVTLDLVASLAAIGRSLRGVFDPQRFLGEFSAQIKPLIPHDRLVMDHLDEDGRTFTVFAEHAPSPLVLHEEHYTTTFAPQARYVVAEWVIRSVFAGEPMLVQDFSADPRFASLNPFERKFLKGGLRSGLFVPLESGGKVIGAILATSLSPNTYGERHLSLLKEMALLIGPFIENIILLERERRRRRRLAALTGLDPPRRCTGHRCHKPQPGAGGGCVHSAQALRPRRLIPPCTSAHIVEKASTKSVDICTFLSSF